MTRLLAALRGDAKVEPETPRFPTTDFDYSAAATIAGSRKRKRSRLAGASGVCEEVGDDDYEPDDDEDD